MNFAFATKIFFLRYSLCKFLFSTLLLRSIRFKTTHENSQKCHVLDSPYSLHFLLYVSNSYLKQFSDGTFFTSRGNWHIPKRFDPFNNRVSFNWINLRILTFTRLGYNIKPNLKSPFNWDKQCFDVKTSIRSPLIHRPINVVNFRTSSLSE